MKILYISIALTGAAQLAAMSEPVAHFEGAVCGNNGLPHCVVSPLSHCVAERDTVKCFDSSESLERYKLKTFRNHQLVWQDMQGSLLRCEKGLKQTDKEHVVPVACPNLNEGLEEYIARMRSILIAGQGDPTKMIWTRDLLENTFWDMPWSSQRCVLAMNIELDLIDSNRVLPVSKLTPLDHAAQQKDIDMIFWLCNKGARKTKHHDTRGYVVQDVMMRSSDPRSLAILKQLSDDGFDFPWHSLAWATDLDPELALKKIHIFTKASNRGGKMSPQRCIARSSVSSLPEGTPGEKAVKEYLLQHSDLFNCSQCIIS